MKNGTGLTIKGALFPSQSKLLLLLYFDVSTASVELPIAPGYAGREMLQAPDTNRNAIDSAQDDEQNGDRQSVAPAA